MMQIDDIRPPDWRCRLGDRCGIERGLRRHYGGAGGDGGAGQMEKDRQARIDQGMGQIDTMFGQYNPDFYKARGKAYTDYAMPQVQKQFAQTKNSLAFALARNGILNSGTAQKRGQDLQSEMDKNITTVASGAQGQENQLRGQVSDARTNLVNQLVASSDPNVVAAQGASATAGLRTGPSFNPLGNMFSDWSQTYLQNINAKAFNPAVPSLSQQLGFA